MTCGKGDPTLDGLNHPPLRLREIVEREHPATPGARRWRLFHLLLPFAATAAALGVVAAVSGGDVVRQILAWGVATFFVLGKFVILKGISGEPFTAFEFAAQVIWQDLAFAWLLTFNLDYVYRLPRVGARLEALEEYGAGLLARKPWMRKLTFAGVVLFVVFPATGTGSIGGSIFGRLIGLGRMRTFLGVFVGTVGGCLLFALLAEGIAGLLPVAVRGSVWLDVAGGAFVVLLLVLLWWRSRRPPGDARRGTGAPAQDSEGR